MRNQARNFAIFWAMALALNCSCSMMTRNDVKEQEQKKNVQDQVVNLQKNTADQNSRFSEINSDLRETNGRIEVLENKLNQLNTHLKDKQGSELQKSQDNDKRLAALQDELAKLEAQIAALNQEIQNLKAQPPPVEARKCL